MKNSDSATETFVGDPLGKKATRTDTSKVSLSIRKTPQLDLFFIIMFRLNALRTVARQANTVARRGYADVASSDALKLSLVLPHETIFAGKEVTQVNVPGVNGEFGILANHVPIIEQLRPGVIQITETSGTTKDYFVSGGFATVQPGSVLSITAIEAFEPTAFSSEAIKSQLAEAQKNVNSSDEAVAATASIQVEVLEALQAIAK